MKDSNFLISQKEKIIKKIGKNVIKTILSRIPREKPIKFSSNELLGISLDKYADYLESLFLNGMTWYNYGRGENQWLIDHIIPLSQFNWKNQDDLFICFNYKNTQPLWHKQNLIKKDKISEDLIVKIINNLNIYIY